MITLSFVREVAFFSKFFKTKASCELKIGDYPPLTVSVEKDEVSVFFLNKLIWQESINKASSNFGVESCDTILKIMKLAQEGKDWSMYPHIYISS